jgi:hypothetical protein
MNKDPNRLRNFMVNQIGEKVQPFLKQIREERNKGNTVDLPAEQIMVNIMSLMIFPFIGRPVFKTILDMDEEDYETFINERHRLLPDYVVSIVMKR